MHVCTVIALGVVFERLSQWLSMFVVQSDLLISYHHVLWHFVTLHPVLSCVMRTTPYHFVMVIRVLGCTPGHVCASLHNTMPAAPSATLYRCSNRCVHLSLHLLLLHALMPVIALLYQSVFCYNAGVLAVVHAVGIMFVAAFLQLLTQPLLPLVLVLLHALLLFCMGHC